MEEWKDIPGYEGLYEVSNLGRIRTKEGKTTSSARFPVRVWKQRILKPKYERRKQTDRKDARVSLWKDGHEKTLLVARLVALAWVDGYCEGMTVNHIDGDTLNNCANNLEWISLADNIRHGFCNGLYPTKKCELTDEEGNKYLFDSLMDANRFLGKNYSYITTCLSMNRLARANDGKRYVISVA